LSLGADTVVGNEVSTSHGGLPLKRKARKSAVWSPGEVGGEDHCGSGRASVRKLKIRLMQSQWLNETILSFPVTWANKGIVIPAIVVLIGMLAIGLLLMPGALRWIWRGLRRWWGGR
jgi:hypothetical protein